MTIYSVYDKPNDPVPAVVPDRFSWFAFLLPPVFALAHGLWLELLAFVVLMLLLGLARPYIGGDALFWVYVILALLAGFEAPALRRGALGRRGYRHRADLVAAAADLAQLEFLKSRKLPQ